MTCVREQDNTDVIKGVYRTPDGRILCRIAEKPASPQYEDEE